MEIPDLLPDVQFRRLPWDEESFRASFDAKRAALGPYIVERWGWDASFQERVHRQRYQEKPFFEILLEGRFAGTVSLVEMDGYHRFGEFYLFPDRQGKGLGTRILRHCLSLADAARLPVRLEYLKWNPVGALYQRHGFVIAGETEIHWQMVRLPASDGVIAR
jgi:GNAT superfamily N-acetyltransferase